MTTVRDVLIYEALESNKQYKEQLKKKKLSDKVKVKIEKGKVLNKERTERLVKKQKARIASGVKVANLAKKTSQGKITKNVKKKTKTRGQLVKELDSIFSRYIRMRDADKNGICSCITCGAKVHWKNIQNGHFITRGNYKYRRSVVNCYPQCMPCNIYKSGNYIAYTLFMIENHGEDKIRKMQEDRELIKISTPEIREMIDLYSHYVDLMMESKKSLKISCNLK